MSSSLKIFPITGQAVVDEIIAALSDEGNCVIRDFETLCTSNCEELGGLWGELLAAREITIPLAKLLSALRSADQVICLEFQSLEYPLKTLFIEDGDVVENTLINEREIGGGSRFL